MKCCHSLRTEAREAQPRFLCCMTASRIKKRISAGRDIHANGLGLVELRSDIAWRLGTSGVPPIVLRGLVCASAVKEKGGRMDCGIPSLYYLKV
jgi:hypothetical protein